MTIIYTDTVTTGTGHALSGIEDWVFLTEGTLLASTTGAGITGSSDDQVVTIAGSVVGSSYNAISLAGNNANLHIMQTGSAVAPSASLSTTAILASGDNAYIVNDGSISARTGVQMNSGTLVNTGSISGGRSNGSNGDGILLFDTDSFESTSIVNSGTITSGAGFFAIRTTAFFDAYLDITNSGLIEGGITVTHANEVNIENSGTINGTLYLGDGDDEVTNTGIIVEDVFLGDGDDTYVNFAEGQAGYDILGEAGNDFLVGGKYVDNIEGGDDDDTIYGREGIDFLDGGNGNDLILGGEGDDTISGGSGEDNLRGGDGDDFIDNITGDSTLRGGRGNDSAYGGDGDDEVFGNDGDDHLNGGDGDDRVSGGRGEDNMEGGDGQDLMYGGADDDEIDGGTGADDIFGGRGDDRITGGTSGDMLNGGHGDDSLTGNGGGDELYGGHGNDEINAGGGSDYIQGGQGDDILTGGSSADVFVFDRVNGHDVVTDFEDGLDLIDLENLNLVTSSTTAVLNAGLDTDDGWLLDLSLLGGEGTVLFEGITESQISISDLIL